MDFSVRLGRTAEGRLNDYVTTTPLRLSVNNNRSLGGISGPRKIKGEREADEEAEWGSREFMEISSGCVSESKQSGDTRRQPGLKFTHPLSELTQRERRQE